MRRHASRLGFHEPANAAARNLRQGRTNCYGVVFSESLNYAFSDPYSVLWLSGLSQSLEQAAPRPQTPYYNEISSGIQQEWTPIHEVNENTPANSQEFIDSVLKGESLL